MYHAGVISKLNKAETNGRFYGSDRGTGYFGTGHYFVDSATKHELDNNSSYSKLPYTSIDISQYDNLFRATTNEIADGLHTFLKNLTKFTQGSDSFSVSELFSQFQKVFGETVMDMQEFDAKLEQLKTYMQNSNISDRGDSVSTQFMKSLGYGGVDTRGTKYADTRYGTVIYDLKEESILQANITDELQKQGQMLEKINYEKGQVFDKSEDTRIQGIIDEQNKVKEIQSEFEKLYDATQLRAYESELDSIDDKLSENKKIIDDCRSSIETADEDARRFAKDFADMFDDEMISDDEIKENADRSRLEYQERISELEEENQLLLARKSEIEANIESEAKLVNAARERAKAIVEERNKPIEDVFQGDNKTTTDASTTAIKEESQALEQVSTSAKEAATSKEKFANANKEVKTSADETAISVDKEISALEKAGNRFESQAAGLAIKPDDQHQFSSWKKQLEDLNIEIAEYKSKVENLSKIDIADEEQIKKAKTEIEDLGKSIKETITVMSKTSQSDRGWTQTGVDKLIQRMNDDLKKNSKYTKETRQNIQSLIDELKNIPDRPLSEIFNDFSRFKREAHDAAKEGKAFSEIFKDKVIYGGAAQLAGMFGFYDIINIFRDGIDTLKEFDDGLTKISYTMDMTKSQLDGLGKSVLEMANDLDSSINNAMQVSQIYANMNTSAEEIKKLSEPTLILSNLTGFDASTVADDIQAVTQQFEIAAEESMHIADVYDQISRNISVDYSKILELILETI